MYVTKEKERKKEIKKKRKMLLPTILDYYTFKQALENTTIRIVVSCFLDPIIQDYAAQVQILKTGIVVSNNMRERGEERGERDTLIVTTANFSIHSHYCCVCTRSGHTKHFIGST
jgi:hypothetical protein